MLRVLHSVSNMDRAGIETMLMNYYRHMDRNKICFDFIVNKPKKGDYDDEIRQMGGNIYLSPGLNPLHYPKYLKFTEEIFKKNPDIKILHAHNEAMGLYALEGAKRCGIKTRIAHAHNTKIIKDYKYPLKIFCKQFLTGASTELWSCGRDAGIYFFGKKKWEEKGIVFCDFGNFGNGIFLFFVYGVRNGAVAELCARFGIDMMGRDYLWQLAGSYYRFSPTYMGRGFEFVDKIVAEWYMAGIIKHA